MGMYDRDWYREDYKRREKEYGGDFSLHSKKVNQSKNELSPIEMELAKCRKKRIREQIRIAIVCPILAIIGLYLSTGSPYILVCTIFVELGLVVRSMTLRKSHEEDLASSFSTISSMASMGVLILLAIIVF